jgi:hypothetical protein
MPLLPFLLLAAAPAVPHPGPIKTFGDWEVACDNVHRCEMTLLVPDDEETGEFSTDFSIVREPGPAGGFTITGGAEHVSGPAQLLVDGKVVGGGTASNDTLTLGGDAARRVVAAMANGKRLALASGSGVEKAHASLAGSAAVLRFIDAEQGRAGTVTAVMAKGGKPASTVPAPAAPPHIAALRAGGVAVRVTPALIRAMASLSKCDADMQTSEPIAGVAIGGGATLVLLPCGSGAYNFNAVPFVVIAGKPVLARFDVPTNGDSDVPMLTNAEWDPKTASLATHAKGRGVGDCGTGEEYVWDGRAFRLVNQARMDACRGSMNWLTVWRATVDRR